MLLSIQLPQNIAAALSLEAARTGQSPASWLLDRLRDRFGATHSPAASRVRLMPDDDTPTDDSHND